MSWNISEVARRISIYLLDRLLQRISGSMLYSSRCVFFFRNCLLNLRVRGLFLMGLDLGSIDRDARGKRGVIFRNVYVFFKIRS